MDYLEKIYKEQVKPIVKIENGKYKLSTKYKIGKIKLLKQKATLELLDKKSQKIFIEHTNLNGAYQDDLVLVQIIFNPKGEIKAKVVEVIKKSNSKILCYVKDKELYTIKEDLLIDCDIVNNKNGDVVLFDTDKIVEIFGNIIDPKVDEKISLFLHNQLYRTEHSNDYNFKQIDLSNRTNLTHLEFCTIDPKSAKDHDDAIYYDEKNQELYVAIADVSSYVLPGTKLDQEAFKRSFSIYFPNKVLPMLPFELSTDLCSLVPNKKRAAYVFKMKLDLKNYCVESSELFEAVIESKHKYSYEYIDEVLEQKEPNNPHSKLFSITSKFRQSRLKKGYNFRNEEIRLILDEEQKIKDYSLETSSASHSLVEECMLLANQEAAKKLQFSGIFRVHEEPNNSKIKKLLEDLNNLGLKVELKKDIHSTILSIQQKAKHLNLEKEVDELIIQAQQQATYSSIKKEHFGLGFKNYSHFTSPIRRYSDLILHRILKTKQIPSNIDEICEKVSQIEREIATLVWDYEDRKYARYLNDNINKTYKAKLVDVESAIVKIDDKIKGARVYIDNYSGQKLFSNLTIKIKSANIISKKVIGSIKE